MSEKKFLSNTPSNVSFMLGLFLGAAVIGVLAFSAIFLLSAGKGAPAANNNVVAVNENANVNEAAAPATPTEMPALTAADHVWGNKDAKVTLMIYSDFECPYCSRHFDTVKQIEAAYKDTVKIVFRHFPLSFHPEAEKASEAAECASEQGKFWEMHDLIFAANKAGKMSVDQWKTDAKTLGLDTKKFNDCLDSGKTAATISADEQGGIAAGVEGTPATFINNNFVSGAMPFESFKTLIDQELAK